LRWIDPLGVMAYGRAIVWIRSDQHEHVTGYSLPAGVHDTPFGWVTVHPDGTRWTGSGVTDCTVAIVGDSVAFGLSVADEDTFAAHLARLLPGVTIINTARVGYDSLNLSRLVQTYHADVYLYLVTDNDDGPMLGVREPGQLGSGIRTYGYWLRGALADNMRGDPLVYGRALRVMSLYPVTLVAFDGDRVGQLAARSVDVQWIEPHNNPISFADPHPNAEGHRAIANNLLPIVMDMIQECE
jgi:hypothetical protein